MYISEAIQSSRKFSFSKIALQAMDSVLLYLRVINKTLHKIYVASAGTFASLNELQLYFAPFVYEY